MNLLIKNLKSTILLVLDRYRSKIGIWLLGMVLLGIGQQAEAADWNLTKKKQLRCYRSSSRWICDIQDYLL